MRNVSVPSADNSKLFFASIHNFNDGDVHISSRKGYQ